jgi:hypothetical protein
MQYTTELNGLDVVVEATVVGKYSPASNNGPEEFPEVTITSISYDGYDIKEEIWPLFADEMYNIEIRIAQGTLKPDGSEA